MQALNDGSGIYEVPPTEGAHEVRVQLGNFDPCGPMHDAGVGASPWEIKHGIRAPRIQELLRHCTLPAPQVTSLPGPMAPSSPSKARLGWFVSDPLCGFTEGSGGYYDLEQQAQVLSQEQQKD